ncbi:hypothetical protein FRC11_012539, partial [Ceratobasidium sp. 423]
MQQRTSISLYTFLTYCSHREEMSAAEMAKFAEFQQDFLDGLESGRCASSNDDPVSNPLDGEAHESDWEDEDEAIITGLGLKSKNTDWARRLANEHTVWSQDLDALTDAYLLYRLGTASGSKPELHPTSTGSDEAKTVSLRCIGLVCEETISFICPSSTPINLVLLKHGYLAPTPIQPRLAISIQVLDLYHALQCRGPSLSAQSIAKALCDLRNVPYERYFRVQLVSAVDAFRMIQRNVQKRLDIAMGRDSPNWRMKHSCGACTYELADEPPLVHSRHVTMDGGDSLKHFAAAGTADMRTFKSCYYLTRDEVNRFKNEVPRKSSTKKGDNQENLSECESRWKNAKIENRADDKPEKVFHETGIFACLCRHSFVLKACDMVRSGELAKYALSIVHTLISELGSDILMGYDIGCTAKGTAERSPLVGPLVRESRFDMLVGSFHGAAHNRKCQLKNHPINRLGAGLTPFENCEQFFSSINRIAALTRLASPYHRHERIHIHLDAWDEDQHRNIGYLLRSRYRHAVKERDTAQATITRLNPEVSVETLEEYIHAEQEYLERGQKPLPEDLFKIEYLSKLKRLRSKGEEYEQCRKVVSHPVGSHSVGLRQSTLVSSNHEARQRNTLDQLILLQDDILRYEAVYGIEQRWTSTSAEWMEAERLEHNQKFQQVVDELERLVVKRLFELSRAGLARTGYKLRMHINKSIARRSGALKSALDRYNEIASQLVPPSPTITWAAIKNARVLEDFDIIRGSCQGISQQDWAKPENRQCAELSRRITRAEEEIQRLNVEVRRVRSLIAHEEVALGLLAKKITDTDPGLGWAAQQYVDLRLHTNRLIARDLTELEESYWYTGHKTVGVPLDTTYVNL